MVSQLVYDGMAHLLEQILFTMGYLFKRLLEDEDAVGQGKVVTAVAARLVHPDVQSQKETARAHVTRLPRRRT